MRTRKVKITEKSVMLECTTRLAYSGWRCLRVPPSKGLTFCLPVSILII